MFVAVAAFGVIAALNVPTDARADT